MTSYFLVMKIYSNSFIIAACFVLGSWEAVVLQISGIVSTIWSAFIIYKQKSSPNLGELNASGLRKTLKGAVGDTEGLTILNQRKKNYHKVLPTFCFEMTPCSLTCWVAVFRPYILGNGYLAPLMVFKT